MCVSVFSFSSLPPSLTLAGRKYVFIHLFLFMLLTIPPISNVSYQETRMHASISLVSLSTVPASPTTYWKLWWFWRTDASYIRTPPPWTSSWITPKRRTHRNRIIIVALTGRNKAMVGILLRGRGDHFRSRRKRLRLLPTIG